MIDRVHHLGLVVHSADEALKFYRDVMGLTVTEDKVIEDRGVRGVLLAVGENEIELLEPTQDDTGVARFLQSKGETLHHICFNTPDIDGEMARLKELGVQLIDEEPRAGIAGMIAFIHPSAMHGVLVELATPFPGAHVSTEKGFDHLAVNVADFDVARETWKSTLGLEVTNTINAEARKFLIGQIPVGQCMIEILAPTAPDSWIAERLANGGERASSMVAIEVDDLDAEIAKYRSKGITLPDGAKGGLPDSRISTISPDQTFGLAIQLIEFRR